jgi:hypothetical protein
MNDHPTMSIIDQTRGDIMIMDQISTARRYPRDEASALKRMIAEVSSSPQVAESCVYAVRRGSKYCRGPSIRFAEIAARNWGNMRVAALGHEEGRATITARAMAWDLQSNTAVVEYAIRPILYSDSGERSGRRYSDDMIRLTAQVATSIATRNAILRMMPADIVQAVLDAAQQCAAMTIRDLVTARERMLETFRHLGIDEAAIRALCGVSSIDQLTVDHIDTMRCIYRAIADGDTTVREVLDRAAESGSPVERVRDQIFELRASIAQIPKETTGDDMMNTVEDGRHLYHPRPDLRGSRRSREKNISENAGGRSQSVQEIAADMAAANA